MPPHTTIKSPPQPQVLDAKAGSAPLGAPLGALIIPIPRHDTTPTTPSIARCAACAAAACPLSPVRPGGGGWSCAFCGAGNPVTGDDVRARGPAAAWPEIIHWDAACVDTPPADDATGLATPPTPAVALVVDVAGGKMVTAELKRELTTALAAAPPRTRVALILVGRAITIVDVATTLDGDSGASAAAVLPGGVVPAADLVAPLAASALAPVGGDARAAAALAALVRAEPGAGVARCDRPRCLGAAVAVALDVVEAAKAACGDDARSPRSAGAPPAPQAMARPVPPVVLGHVVVIATGPPSRGPGALASKACGAFWEGVVRRATSSGTTLDAICIGGDGAVAAPVLTRVSSATGGRVLLNNDGATGIAARVGAALAARSAVDATLQLWWSPPLVAVPVAVPGNDVRVDACACCAAITIPAPRAGDCAAVRLDVASPLAGAAAAIQAIATWTDVATGARVTRVATRTVAPAADAESALRAVRADLTALLLVKGGAATALAAGATEAACAAAEAAFVRHVADAAAATNQRATRVGSRRWLRPSSRLHRLPAALLPLADALYGAARAPAFAAPDAGERARSLAVVAAGGPDAALRGVRPGMYVCDPTRPDTDHASLLPVPPADLVLAASPAALLDCGDTVFVWVAPGAPQSARAAVHSAAASLAAARTPPPQLRVVRVDSAAARAASWRLAPLHRDSDAEAALQAPVWGRLTEAQRATARHLVTRTGDPSFVEWCREAGAEPLFDLDRESFV